ncbi:MAG: hypothetical protein IH891_10085 [Planctomycetes bacterium]|nr:hypothetical protein [Planctomycetota bacterium]
MNGSRSNAFLGQGFSIGGHPRSSLASMLASMRAKLETNAGGYRLSLTPMRFIDAMPRWFDIDPGPHVRNLLLDSPAPVSNPSPAPSSLNRLLDRCNITARDSFGDDLKVLDDDGLRKLVAGNVDEKPCSDLKGVPAWKINGEFYYGEKSFRELIKISGCDVKV